MGQVIEQVPSDGQRVVIVHEMHLNIAVEKLSSSIKDTYGDIDFYIQRVNFFGHPIVAIASADPAFLLADANMTLSTP